MRRPANRTRPRATPRRGWAGLLVQKWRWSLSLRAKGLFIIAFLGLAFVYVRGVYPFLAVSAPVSGGLTVIEGWIHETGVVQAVAALDAEHERDIIIVCALITSEFDRKSGRQRAEYIAAKLMVAGVPQERIHLVFAEVASRDRTYHTALALKSWLRGRGPAAGSLNVITAGPHARRSRLLFRKAFGKGVKVGIFPIEDPDICPIRWWRSSEGVSTILYQTIAFFYAKLFFRP